MTGRFGRNRVSSLGAAFVLALALSGLTPVGPVGPTTAAAAALAPWTGSVDLYRAGTFTTQKSWLWCTAADVQIIANIVDRTADHAKAAQARYFAYMREHNRYAIPETDGVDPVGWTAGLRHFVDDRYRLAASRSFDAALRSAVTSIRRTGLPVGLTVGHGTHAWVLTGFSASADPAATTDFRVTTVRVVGPLWGLQSRTYGYDMRPNTELTRKQLAGFFTPWHYAGVRMAWEGRWVSVQPSGAAVSPAAPSPPTASAVPSVVASPSPSTPTASGPATASADPGPVAVASRLASPPASRAPAERPAPVVERTASVVPVLALLAGVIVLGLGAAVALARLRARPGRPPPA
jgi:hypothetical protein